MRKGRKEVPIAIMKMRRSWRVNGAIASRRRFQARRSVNGTGRRPLVRPHRRRERREVTASSTNTTRRTSVVPALRKGGER